MNQFLAPASPAGRRRVLERLRSFPSNETGDEGVNKILIIAMIAVPLIIALIVFGGEIKKFFTERWEKLKGKSEGFEGE